MWYVAGVAILVALSLLLYFSGSVRRTETTHTIWELGDARSVLIDVDGGDVLFTTSGSSACAEVIRRTSFTFVRPPIHDQLEGDELRLVTRASGIDRPSRVDHEIRLPADPSMRITVKTTTGEVVGLGLTTDVLEARTSNGTIELEFDRPPKQVDATSGSGSILVTVPADGVPYAVDARTSAGTAHVAVPTDATATHHLRVHSGNGSVTVLPMETSDHRHAPDRAVFRPWPS